MPKGDRTGPMGTGSRSGRAAGFCAGFDVPGYANAIPAGGAGMGTGRMQGGWDCRQTGGRGRRNRIYGAGAPGRISPATGSMPAPELEKEFLRNRSQALQSELDTINKRLGEMD